MKTTRLQIFAALVLCGMISGCLLGNENRLATSDMVQHWHEAKAGSGPTFAGNPAWLAHMSLVEQELRKRGVVDLERQPFTYSRWFTADDPAAGDWSLKIGEQSLPVASYWAYSGTTDAAGVTAPLVIYKKGMSHSQMVGHIVVFEVPPIPASMAKAFNPESVYVTESDIEAGISSEQWFQGNYPTRFGRFDDALRGSDAAGAIVIFNLSPPRAAGLYTFPLLNADVIGVPGLYLDREAGQQVKAAAATGQLATLRLVANTEQARTWFLHGIVPGKHYGTDADELVLMTTHTDGPNLTQENGAFAMIALAEQFSGRSLERSLLIVLDPQHYMPGRHRVDWFDTHPALTSRIVASIGIEQLGQREYTDIDGRYGVSDRAEPTLLFAQDNPLLVQAAIAAVERHKLPRTLLRVPSRGKQGVWQGLGDIAIKKNWPGYGTNTGMSGYWSTGPGIESFDAELFNKQVRVVVDLIDLLANTPREDLAIEIADPHNNPALAPGVPR